MSSMLHLLSAWYLVSITLSFGRQHNWYAHHSTYHSTWAFLCLSLTHASQCQFDVLPEEPPADAETNEGFLKALHHALTNVSICVLALNPNNPNFLEFCYSWIATHCHFIISDWYSGRETYLLWIEKGISYQRRDSQHASEWLWDCQLGRFVASFIYLSKSFLFYIEVLCWISFLKPVKIETSRTFRLAELFIEWNCMSPANNYDPQFWNTRLIPFDVREALLFSISTLF